MNGYVGMEKRKRTNKHARIIVNVSSPSGNLAVTSVGRAHAYVKGKSVTLCLPGEHHMPLNISYIGMYVNVMSNCPLRRFGFIGRI